MSNSALHTTRKTSNSSTQSTGNSPSASPINQVSKTYGLNSGAGMNTLSTSWTQESDNVMWPGSAPAQRQPSGSSTTTTDLSGSQRDTWSSSRPSSGAWDLPPGSDRTGSPKKNDFAQLDPPSPNSLSQHNRQDRRSSGMAGTRLDERSAKTGPRFSNVSSPSKPPAYGTSPHYSNGTGAYEVANTTGAVDEITASLRGMVVGDDYSNSQQSTYRQGIATMPQPQNIPPQSNNRPPFQHHQARPSFNAYNPQADYTAYYTGSTGGDYPYNYESYRSNPDGMVYGSPAQASGGVTAPSMYPGVAATPVHPHTDVHGQSTGMFYNFPGSPRPTGSQFYYQAPQAMVFHSSAPPHSPMQATAISTMAPASLSDKKREMQYAIQQHQQLNQMYASGRHSTPSPHAPPYGTLMDYAGQLQMGLLNGQAVTSQALAMFQQSLNHGRRLEGEAGGITLRSPLLEEFRANKNRKWELKDIFGHVVEFSGDQHGSRFIQQRLETATSEEKQIVFDEIVPDAALQLMQDVFGNYVIQKLFEHGTQVQKTVLASTMENHILSLSLQMYGCRVVQKAVEFILPEQQVSIVNELESHVLKCVKDSNGNHVIQKLIERISPERLGFVQAFRGNVYDLSTHPYGCRVLQRCFEHLPEEQTRPLLDELHKYTTNLMQDQFGNYVVQFVLEKGPVQDRLQIISRLRGQMLQMARHKFASNVCEKALVTADSESRRLLIEEIMAPKADGVSPIVTMMKDQYANYVLQRALSVVEGEQKDLLVSKIRPQLTTMRRYSSAYSKHLISIERLLEKTTQSSHSVNGNSENFNRTS